MKDADENEESDPVDPRLTRRGLLTGAGLGSAAFAAGGFLSAFETADAARPAPKASMPQDHRLAQAFDIRVKAARHERDLGAAAHLTNSEEEAIPGRAACYSKGLPHDKSGNVDSKAYDIYLAALRSGRPEDLERIPLGGFVKLANPQSAWAFDLIGPDSSQVPCPPAPGFASAEQAGEIVELYWQALLRDAPFTAYGSHALVEKATAELSANTAFTGPRREAKVTPETLFRGSTAGDLEGPYISQFLWKPVPFLPIKIEQKIRTAVPSVDYMTDFEGWLAIQNGALSGVNHFDESPRYIRNGRDLGEYVHRDFTYQSFLSACLIALKAGTQPDGGNPINIHARRARLPPSASPSSSICSPSSRRWRSRRAGMKMDGPPADTARGVCRRIEAHASGRAKYPLPDGCWTRWRWRRSASASRRRCCRRRTRKDARRIRRIRPDTR